MPEREKVKRNREIVQRRVTNPREWSVRSLADHYNVWPNTIQNILDRDMEKYATVEQIKAYREALKQPKHKRFVSVQS